MKCDQDLCLNFWYDLKKLLWQDELNPRVRCAFGNVLNPDDTPSWAQHCPEKCSAPQYSLGCEMFQMVHITS